VVCLFFSFLERISVFIFFLRVSYLFLVCLLSDSQILCRFLDLLGVEDTVVVLVD